MKPFDSRGQETSLGQRFKRARQYEHMSKHDLRRYSSHHRPDSEAPADEERQAMWNASGAIAGHVEADMDIKYSAQGG